MRERFIRMKNELYVQEAKLRFYMGRFFAEVHFGRDEIAMTRIDSETESLLLLIGKMRLTPEVRSFLTGFVQRAGEFRKAEIRTMLGLC